MSKDNLSVPQERTSTPVQQVTRLTTNETVKIKMERLEGYAGWDALGDWSKRFTEAELVTLLMRAADQASRSEIYRKKAAAKARAIKQLLADNPELAAQLDEEMGEGE